MRVSIKGLGSDYSACLSPRTMDYSTEWGYSAVRDNSRSDAAPLQLVGELAVDGESRDFRGIPGVVGVGEGMDLGDVDDGRLG
eukprot:627064-Amorphochlora_amoeboformis.AAC.1